MSWLKKLFGKGEGDFGTLLDWQSIGTLKLENRLFVGDGQMAPTEPGAILDMPPGDYDVSIREIVYANDRRVANLRVLKDGAAETEREEFIDQETYADSGTQGVCDYENYLKAYQKWDEDEYFEKFNDSLCPDVYGVTPLDPETNAVLFMSVSGFGDGTFPIYELRADGVRVGIDVQFIDPDKPY